MDKYMDEEVRKKRSKKLIEGNCSLCGSEAQIPWMKRMYCYRCWTLMWKFIKEELHEKEKKDQKAEETRQEEIEETVRNFLRNK